MTDVIEKVDLAIIHEALGKVQKELTVPKNHFNSFGKYYYRNCEDILEAIKKVMPEGASVTIDDEVWIVGDRYYIKATASFNYRGMRITAQALAREAAEKKGMDVSQVTGATSSYARKYALNALFCIDDSKDEDVTNSHGHDPKKNSAPAQQHRPKDLEKLRMMCKNTNTPETTILEAFKINSLEDMNSDEYDRAIRRLDTKLAEQLRNKGADI